MFNFGGGFRFLLGARLSAVRADSAATSCRIRATAGGVIPVAAGCFGFLSSGVSSLSLWGGLVTRVDLRCGTGVTFVTMVRHRVQDDDYQRR